VSEAAYQGDVLADIRRLIEEDATLTELTAHRGYPIWLSYAERVRDAWSAKLLAGHVDNMEDLKYGAGFIEACRQLIGIPDSVARALDRARADVAEVEPEPAPEYASGVE
jgi:hypothetical protein